MKNINCKANRPVSFGLLGNTLLLMLNQTSAGETEIGQFFTGALLGLTATACLKGIWDIKHKKSLSE